MSFPAKRVVGGNPETLWPSSPSHDGFDFIVLMRAGIVPNGIDRARRVFIDQRLQQFGDFSPPLAALKQDHGFTGVIIDGAQTLVLLGVTQCRNHDLLAEWAPQRLLRSLTCSLFDLVRSIYLHRIYFAYANTRAK